MSYLRIMILLGLCALLLPGCGSGGSSGGPGGTTGSTTGSTTGAASTGGTGATSGSTGSSTGGSTGATSGGTGVTTSSGLSATFREFPVPVAGNVPNDPYPGCWPDDLVMDQAGNIWFAEHHSSEIGEMQPTGSTFSYRGYPTPTPNSEMDSIAVDDQRGLVWLTENEGDKIIKLNRNAVVPLVSEIDVRSASNPHPIPGDITVDANGIPWFTEGYEGGPVKGAVAQINISSSQISEYPAPSQPGGLDGLRFDRAGNLWFVELSNNKICRFGNNQMTEFTLPRPNVVPTNLAIDSRGLIWVTEQGADAIAVLDPTMTNGAGWQELPVPKHPQDHLLPGAGGSSGPAGIAIDSSDNVWFTEFNSSRIGLMQAGSSTVVDFPIPTADSGPEDVCAASDGRIFFTEQYGNKIGQIMVGGLALGRARG